MNCQGGARGLRALLWPVLAWLSLSGSSSSEHYRIRRVRAVVWAGGLALRLVVARFRLLQLQLALALDAAHAVGFDGDDLAVQNRAVAAHGHLGAAAGRGSHDRRNEGDASGQDGQAAAAANQVDAGGRRMLQIKALLDYDGATAGCHGDITGGVHADVCVLERHAGRALVQLEFLVGRQLVAKGNVLVFVLIDGEFLLASHLALVVVGEELRDLAVYQLDVLAVDDHHVFVLGLVAAYFQAAVIADRHVFVVADLNLAVRAHAQALVVLDQCRHILLGLRVQLFGALLVFEAKLVEVVRRAAFAAAALDAALGAVGRQIVGWLVVSVVQSAGDHGPVGIAIQKAHDDFLTDARHVDGAPVATGPRLRHAHPAGGLLVVPAFPIPIELNPNAAKLVGPDLFASRTDDKRRLRARHLGF